MHAGGRAAHERDNGKVTGGEIRVRVAEPLRGFLRAGQRGGDLWAQYDGTSSLGHVVQSLGIPLPEVGRLGIDGYDVGVSHRPSRGDVVDVAPIERPQALPPSGARFVLDVHLGSLARRLRLLGLDTWYGTAADDDELVHVANAEDRILLSKDRGLLFRRTLQYAAYVRGSTVDQQVVDVLDRFMPPLAPFTRCAVCNGTLERVDKSAIAEHLKPGTARSYHDFAQCTTCRQVYWRGAHSSRLESLVTTFTDPRGLRSRVADWHRGPLCQ
jgi:uncharacterized protein with PIN domain